MDSLATLYLKAFNWLSSYFNEILNALLPDPITIGGSGWLDFFYFGFTDLNSYLSFVFSLLLFIFIHYLIYRLIKYLFKLFGGLVHLC